MLADELEALAARATPGPWEVDTIENDGAYGSGPDAAHGFKSPVMLNAEGKALFDAFNSDLIEVHEEYDEDSCTAWDETGRRNFDLVVALQNNLPTIIAALRSSEAQATDCRKAALDVLNAGDADLYDIQRRGEYIPPMRTASARIKGDKDRSIQSSAPNRALAIEAHRLRSVLRYIGDAAYVDHQSGNANFEYLQRIARDELGQGMSTGTAKPVDAEAEIVALREETYTEWQQKRGMLVDKVDWAINEYDQFMLDDSYDAQRVLDYIIYGLREVRELRLEHKDRT